MNEEWTVYTLKEHMERILDEHAIAHKAEHMASEVSLKAAFTSAEKAIEKTEASNHIRFTAVNEFRALVNDVMRRLELAQAACLTIREFKEFTDRQEERGREVRQRLEAEKASDARSRMAIMAMVGLALFSAFISIALAASK